MYKPIDSSKIKRGGKRKGAGRKPTGMVDRRVALSLFPNQWEVIEFKTKEQESSLASYIRGLIENDILNSNKK